MCEDTEHQSSPPEEEIDKVRGAAAHQLTIIKQSYEGISKLLITLASGALVLSIALKDLGKEPIICWVKSFLLFSWIAFILSLYFGIQMLFFILRYDKNLTSKLIDLQNEANSELERAKEASTTGNVSISGLLSSVVSIRLTTEMKTWPIVGQLIAFGIGAFLLFIAGILTLVLP